MPQAFSLLDTVGIAHPNSNLSLSYEGYVSTDV